MILIAGFLHTHECGHEAFVCLDCVEHVKHKAHISQASVMDFDCVLCKTIRTDYLTPEVQVYSAIVLLFVVIATRPISDGPRRMAVLLSLRAPPVTSYC